MKNIILHVSNDAGFKSRFQAALDIARGHGGHVSCVQAVSDFGPVVDPMGGAFNSSVIQAEMREAARTLRTEIEARLSEEDVSWDFECHHGDISSVLLEHGNLADLMVLSQAGAPKASQTPSPDIAGEIVDRTRTMMLLLPIGQNAFKADGPLVIAWNGSAEAAHAIRLSLPMLKMAREVHVVSVSEEGQEFPQSDASLYLSRHDIGSELHEITSPKKLIAKNIEEFASERGASAIIMGAYGHSRLRETLLGGVTKDLLRDSKLPLLLVH